MERQPQERRPLGGTLAKTKTTTGTPAKRPLIGTYTSKRPLGTVGNAPVGTFSSKPSFRSGGASPVFRSGGGRVGGGRR